MGYHRAGFSVTGIDIAPMAGHYPFDFVQHDAIKYILQHGTEYDIIHASPPCQASSALTKGTNKGRTYPQLISATRDALNATGRPWIIENVAGAAIRKDIMLCGEMFGLRVIRHRYFELSHHLTPPTVGHHKHRGRAAGLRHGQWFVGPYFAVYGQGGGKGNIPQWQDAMGIDWTRDRKAIAEAIPPAYTEFLGSYLMRNLYSPLASEDARDSPPR
jgi:DNA (cytosine-5)-methyltransferase 1